MKKSNHRKPLLVVLISVIVLLALIFVFKTEWLTVAIGDNFPVGTLVSWLSAIIYAAVMIVIFSCDESDKLKKLLLRVLKFNLFLAAVWGFISFLLAGNWAFSFNHPKLFSVWIVYTLLIFFLPIIVFVSWGATFLIRKIFAKK